MTRGGELVRRAGRALALGASALALLATSVVPCGPADTEVSFDAATSCGPAGLLTVLYGGADNRGCECADLVEAPGANAVGLPELGGIDLEDDAEGFADGGFVLRGPVPFPGASPPTTVERACRFTRIAEGVLEVTCTGAAPEAPCAGTATVVAGGN